MAFYLHFRAGTLMYTKVFVNPFLVCCQVLVLSCQEDTPGAMPVRADSEYIDPQ